MMPRALFPTLIRSDAKSAIPIVMPPSWRPIIIPPLLIWSHTLPRHLPLPQAWISSFLFLAVLQEWLVPHRASTCMQSGRIPGHNYPGASALDCCCATRQVCNCSALQFHPWRDPFPPQLHDCQSRKSKEVKDQRRRKSNPNQTLQFTSCQGTYSINDQLL